MLKYLISDASYLTDIIPLLPLAANETTIDTILSTNSKEFLTHINVFASKIHFTPVSLVLPGTGTRCCNALAKWHCQCVPVGRVHF